MEEATEWDDIQRRFGNRAPLPPRELTVDEAAFENFVVSTAQSFKEKQEEDEEGSDERIDSDDEFLEEYRKKRLEELQSKHSSPSFGSVVEIQKEQVYAFISVAHPDT